MSTYKGTRRIFIRGSLPFGRWSCRDDGACISYWVAEIGSPDVTGILLMREELSVQEVENTCCYGKQQLRESWVICIGKERDYRSLFGLLTTQTSELDMRPGALE